MPDVLREVAMSQYGKLEYPVTHEELYVKGFEAGAQYVYDRLREERLKEVESTMVKMWDTLASWSREAKE